MENFCNGAPKAVEFCVFRFFSLILERIAFLWKTFEIGPMRCSSDSLIFLTGFPGLLESSGKPIEYVFKTVSASVAGNVSPGAPVQPQDTTLHRFFSLNDLHSIDRFSVLHKPETMNLI